MKAPAATIVVLLLFTGGALADKFAPPDFNERVLPVLQKYCVSCHGEDEASGGLALHTYEHLLEGGGKGPVIVAGKSGESRIVLTVEGKAKPKMPPKDNPKPTAEEYAVVKAWIDGGARAPRAAAPPMKFEPPRIAPRGPRRTPVQALAYSPKGDLLAVGGDGKVALVEPATGYIVREWSGAAGRIHRLVFSSDGAFLLAAAGEPGYSGQAAIWSLGDGKLARVLGGHKDCLYAVAITADGKTIATAGYDKVIRLWDAASGKETKTLAGHNDAVFDLAFSPNGKFLASASGDRTVKLWDVASGERLDTFSQALKDLYAVAYSPAGDRVIAGGVDNRIRAWRISDSGREGSNPILESRFAHQGAIVCLVYSPDGKWIASSSEDRAVKIWDAARLRELRLLETQPDWANALAFSPDNHHLAVGRHDGSVAVYNPRSGEKERDLSVRERPPEPPELANLSVQGLERGAATRVRLSGKRLADVHTVRLSTSRYAAAILKDPPPRPDELWISLRPFETLPRSPVQLSVVGPGGESKTKTIHVDSLPAVHENEPNDRADKATPGAAGAIFWGVLEHRGDQDHFAFDLKKGQAIVLAASAKTIGSKLDATLTVYDPHHRVVASRNDSEGPGGDPVLYYTAADDGRHVLRVGDLAINGSAEHFYSVAVGEFPFVTAVFPLGVPIGPTATAELVGYHLPRGAKVEVPAGKPGELEVPLDPEVYRFARRPRLLIGGAAESLEKEPNDRPESATALPLPGVIDGRLFAAGGADEDLFSFEAKKGESWILETDAARRGAPTDTRIEVLDGSGNPIDRVWLQAVRDSAIDFRGINSRQAEVRIFNWEEMELNQYLYLRGEVTRLFRMPQGPDSGFVLYTEAGARRTYFDTTATAHSKNDPCYIVEPHPPGAALVPNGLPVFKLKYQNDDSGDRRLGSDSRLWFEAPADGKYLVRVRDARGRQGPEVAYRLIVRRPSPDFLVSVGPANPTVGAGSGRELEFNVDRIDGFSGPIRIDVAGLPTGFSLSSPVVVEAGHDQARASLVAAPDAPAPPPGHEASIQISASADVSGKSVSKPVAGLGKIQLVPKPKLLVRLEPAEVTIAPGGTASARLIIERNGFDDRVNFVVNNLPHGVIVDNIGLNGILIPKGEKERTIYFAARDWVPAQSRACHALSQVEGNQASAPIVVHVRPPQTLAEAKPSP